MVLSLTFNWTRRGSVLYRHFLFSNPEESFIILNPTTLSNFYRAILTSTSIFITISIAFILNSIKNGKRNMGEIIGYIYPSLFYIFTSLFLSILGLSIFATITFSNLYEYQFSIENHLKNDIIIKKLKIIFM